MHLALAAVGKVVGTGLAGAAGSGGFASTALTVLQGASAALGVIGQLGASNASAQAAEDAAVQADLQAGQEKVEATNQQTQMKKELMRILGENEVAAANAGIDISAGVAQQANATAKRDAHTSLTVSRNDQEFQSALYRLRSNGLRQKAKSQRQAGLLNAVGAGVDFGISLYNRG